MPLVRTPVTRAQWQGHVMIQRGFELTVFLPETADGQLNEVLLGHVFTYWSRCC